MTTDADYADIKRRLLGDTVSVGVLHVQGAADAATMRSRQGLTLYASDQAMHLYACVGVPAASLGNNGDYALRIDGAAGAHLYFKTGGAWSALT